VPKADIRVDCSVRKEEPPDVVRGFVGQMLFGRSAELIVQPDAHDVEVGTATPVKHETSIALTSKVPSLLRLTASLFALGPELPTLLTM
jgi:hypothetical protein